MMTIVQMVENLKDLKHICTYCIGYKSLLYQMLTYRVRHATYVRVDS